MSHAFFAAASLLLVGCHTTAKFNYPADMGALFEAPNMAVDKIVAVLPFGDCRGGENSDALMSLYILPISPFGMVEYDEPENGETFVTIERYKGSPFVDLAKATATSFSRSGMFRNVRFAFGSDLKEADFIVTGRIDKFRYSATIYSYGLSLAGSILWMLGAPAGTSVNTLSCELQMRNRKGDVIWKYAFSRSRELLQGLYFRAGEDCGAFPALYQDGMNEALADLAARMKANPDLFR